MTLTLSSPPRNSSKTRCQILPLSIILTLENSLTVALKVQLLQRIPLERDSGVFRATWYQPIWMVSVLSATLPTSTEKMLKQDPLVLTSRPTKLRSSAVTSLSKDSRSLQMLVRQPLELKLTQNLACTARMQQLSTVMISLRLNHRAPNSSRTLQLSWALTCLPAASAPSRSIKMQKIHPTTIARSRVPLILMSNASRSMRTTCHVTPTSRKI